MAAADHHRIQRVAVPMARELREVLIQHIVERIVAGIQRLVIPRFRFASLRSNSSGWLKTVPLVLPASRLGPRDGAWRRRLDGPADEKWRPLLPLHSKVGQQGAPAEPRRLPHPPGTGLAAQVGLRRLAHRALVAQP